MTHADQLLFEAVENRGYASGYTDGRANGRMEGRQERIKIAQRRIAQALQREGLMLTTIAKVLNLSPTAVQVWLSE